MNTIAKEIGYYFDVKKDMAVLRHSLKETLSEEFKASAFKRAERLQLSGWERQEDGSYARNSSRFEKSGFEIEGKFGSHQSVDLVSHQETMAADVAAALISRSADAFVKEQRIKAYQTYRHAKNAMEKRHLMSFNAFVKALPLDEVTYESLSYSQQEDVRAFMRQASKKGLHAHKVWAWMGYDADYAPPSAPAIEAVEAVEVAETVEPVVAMTQITNNPFAALLKK
jgi:hypothetical protein